MPQTPRHLAGTLVCPFLPLPEQALDSSHTRRLGRDRGEAFYLAALEYSHSLWLQGYPARSLLLINRALGADLSGHETALDTWPLPYKAAAWVMTHRSEDQFVGNPRRHYQHLATRMVEPRKQQRSWRAWACWFMACRIFPDYPADEKQISDEGVIEPNKSTILGELNRYGIPGEAELWLQAAEQEATPVPAAGG